MVFLPPVFEKKTPTLHKNDCAGHKKKQLNFILKKKFVYSFLC
jgi:hypothetical protein